MLTDNGHIKLAHNVIFTILRFKVIHKKKKLDGGKLLQLKTQSDQN